MKNPSFILQIFILGISTSLASCQLGLVAGMSGGMTPADHALLDSAVKQIVHPMATPTAGMISTALMQGAPPSTMMQVMQYLPEMQALARRMGVKAPQATGVSADAALDAMILDRATNWLQQQNMMRAMTGGGGFLDGMGVFGGMGVLGGMGGLGGMQGFGGMGGFASMALFESMM